MTTAHTVFWTASALLVYTYVGYPLIMWLAARVGRTRLHKKELTPRISILVVAHNEAARIANRIDNILSLDYPPELLDIVIASDGSTDDTVALAREYLDERVQVREFVKQRGKPAILNELIPQLSGDIVVLMDVRQRIDRSALRVLAANFCDDRVGAVSGELMLHQDDNRSEVGQGVGFYWRYEKFIRQQESRVDSTIGTTGAFYALRKRLFQPIPMTTILDDVLIPMQITRQGYRVLFDADAQAHDRVAKTADAEFTRKVRTIAGNFQLLFRESWLLNPRRNRLWFQTLSHKFGRLFGPLWLVIAFISNLFLLDSALYRELLLLQVLFYSAALAGHASKTTDRLPGVNIAYAFCLLNWATVLGFLRFLRGKQAVTWQKAQS